LAAARAAGEITLKYFQMNPRVETKADRSPVTVADRESERLLRQRIEERYPEHGILGEEFGATRPAAEWKWVLDPIDGTQSFIRGVPLYGVMVGVQKDAEPVIGVVHFPALGETVWAAAGSGTWWNGARAHASNVARLEEATLLATDSLGFAAVGKEDGYQRLRQRVGCERGWGDCYGHILVATGRAEIMLDPILHEWDAAPLIPILEEAGGRFVDWRGARNVRATDGIGTNGALFDAVMKIVRGE
jgi:histidinol phosphatase-like enzyme (inositol monophosphatase family)